MTGLEILAIIAAIIGLVGSVVPGLPGPPISWAGLLLVYLAGSNGQDGASMTTNFLFIWLAITVAVTAMDYIVPAWFTRVTGGHKAASAGAIIGLFAGLFIPPVGMIVGSLLGAFLAEFIVEDSGAWPAFKASIGAFLGFITGTLIKLVSAGIMAYYIFAYIF